MERLLKSGWQEEDAIDAFGIFRDVCFSLSTSSGVAMGQSDVSPGGAEGDPVSVFVPWCNEGD